MRFEVSVLWIQKFVLNSTRQKHSKYLGITNVAVYEKKLKILVCCEKPLNKGVSVDLRNAVFSMLIKRHIENLGKGRKNQKATKF